jgi:hypothetical protein
MRYAFVSLITILIFQISPVAAQPRVHPAFAALTEPQVTSEFADYEAKGKKCAEDRARNKACAAVKFSPEQPLNIPMQGSLGGELLTFSVSIAPPKSQVRKFGYEFGLVARQRTPADRADVLRRLVARMQGDPSGITFTFKLIARRDWSESLPPFTFAIVNESGSKVWSSSQPDFECGERDIICQVGLKESGVTIAFPFFLPPNRMPFITDAMRVLKLIVTLDGQDEPIDFDLNSVL